MIFFCFLRTIPEAAQQPAVAQHFDKLAAAGSVDEARRAVVQWCSRVGLVPLTVSILPASDQDASNYDMRNKVIRA